MKTYYPTIGLEVHAELATNSKMFCGCKNDPDEEKPNTNICPVCMAHPGALPTINKKALEHVVRVGLALSGTIADYTEFDRKSYFYPDIPKGYQITQYKYPIVSGGELKGVKITRVHLEEDTATSSHDQGEYSLVDFNRAGVPLMELVTEPVIHSAEEASMFARELQLLFRTLGVSHANMEKGQMRVEANISISDSPEKFGTKVEVKNLNSFKSVERAIRFELARMQELIEAGRGSEIVQETRGWDEIKQKTFSQRSKENATDYRYFPDPDLPKLVLSEIFNNEELSKNLGELPEQKRIRFAESYGLKSDDIEMYVSEESLGSFFENVVSSFTKKELSLLASNYILSDLMGILGADESLSLPDPKKFSKIIEMVDEGLLSSRGAKDTLLLFVKNGGDPEQIAKDGGFIQQNDEGALKIVVQKIIDENGDVVATYKAGKENAIMSLVGKVMKESGGSANPALVTKLLKELV